VSEQRRRVIDITTTATLRPAILAQTLDSFFENLLGGTALHHFEYRHILNIDCVGDDCVPYDVIHESEKRFGTMPTVRIAEDPNFTRAFRWVWQQAAAEYVFHLEDDWVMQQPVSLVDMVSFLDEHQDFALLRLNKFESAYRPLFKPDGPLTHLARQWNRHMPWSQELGIFEVPDEYKMKLGFSGNPSLLRGEFVQEFVKYLQIEEWDPEVQLHLMPDIEDSGSSIMRWRYGIWQKQKSRATIRDIGRVWCEQHGWHKHRGLGFTHWERMTDGQTAAS